MAFLKKHLIWVVLALVLAGEGVFTVMLVGRKSQIATRLDDLEKKREEAQRFERTRPGEDYVIKAYQRRQGTVRDELTDALLFLWHRGQSLERLFPDPDLGKFKPRPWDIVGGLDRFRLQYQNSYNREVGKLLPKIKDLLVTRESVGLADANYFTQPEITVGDIFAAQKRFWIIRKVVEIADDTGVANLPQLNVLRAGDVGVRRRLQAVRAARGETSAKAAQLFSPITLDIAVRCKALKLDKFLEALHASPLLCARIKSVIKIERSTDIGAPVRSAPTRVHRPVPGAPERRPSRLPGAMTPEMMMEGAAPPDDRGAAVGDFTPVRPGPAAPPPLPPPVEPRDTSPAAPPTAPGRHARRGLLVEAQFLCEVPDFNVELYQVAFSKSPFKGKTPVESQIARWLQARVRDADAMLRDAKATKEEPNWVSDAKAAFRQGGGEESAKEQAEPILAYPGSSYERTYVFDKAQFARDWLAAPQDYVALRAEALKALWQRVLDAVPTDRATVDGRVVVTFRPESHFGSERFDQTLTVPAPPSEKGDEENITVTVKFRLVTYQPDESATGLRYMAGSLRY